MKKYPFGYSTASKREKPHEFDGGHRPWRQSRRMKVTRQMLHPDLRPFSVCWTTHILKYFYRAKWSTKISSAIVSRMIKSEAPESINVEERFLPTGDGEAELRVKIYRPVSEPGDLPAMLYTHGGGYVTGSPDVFDGQLAKFIGRRPCVIVAPAYRNALTKPYPVPLGLAGMTSRSLTTTTLTSTINTLHRTIDDHLRFAVAWWQPMHSG